MSAVYERTELEQKFYTRFLQLGEGLPIPQEQYQPIKHRKWRCDFAWPAQKVIVEVEGGIFSEGRHSRGVGYSRDCDKYNTLQLDGWIVLRYTVLMIDNDPLKMIHDIRVAIESAEAKAQATNQMLGEIAEFRRLGAMGHE